MFLNKKHTLKYEEYLYKVDFSKINRRVLVTMLKTRGTIYFISKLRLWGLETKSFR